MGQGLEKQRARATGPGMRRLLEACERRWALRVIWELRAGPRSFRGLREACGGVSPSVLQRRLHDWRELGVIESIPRLGYRLTAAGEQLFQVLSRLDKWAETHAGDPARR